MEKDILQEPFTIRRFSDIPLIPKAREKFGKWKIIKNTIALRHPLYEVDLERMDSSAAMLDWIFQIFHKTWADKKTMYDLLDALNAIYVPQSHYCSGAMTEGKGKNVDSSMLAKRYIQRIKENQ